MFKKATKELPVPEKDFLSLLIQMKVPEDKEVTDCILGSLAAKCIRCYNLVNENLLSYTSMSEAFLNNMESFSRAIDFVYKSIYYIDSLEVKDMYWKIIVDNNVIYNEKKVEIYMAKDSAFYSIWKEGISITEEEILEHEKERKEEEEKKVKEQGTVPNVEIDDITIASI